MKPLAAILAGAVLLAWPAVLNGYPLVFSDTGGFLHQTLGPLMLWDKPWVYGPFLHLFHWRVSLWLSRDRDRDLWPQQATVVQQQQLHDHAQPRAKRQR